MSKYTIKVITQNANKTLQLSRGNITKIQAEESAIYQIFNEQGELVLNPKIKKINEDDLAIYIEGEEQPLLILEDYYDVYPIEDSAYLADNSASLATSSSELVLATEVTSGMSPKIAYGLGIAALLGGVLALSGGSSGGGSSKPSKPSELNKPAAPVDNEIAHPTITLNDITADNIVNIAERSETVSLGGKVSNVANSEAKAGDKITVKIGNQSFETLLNADLSFEVQASGQLLAENRKITVTLETADATGNRLSTVKNHAYQVDTDIAAPTLVIDTIATDNIINAVEKREETMTITGSAVNGSFAEAKAGDKVVLQIGDLRVEGQLTPQLTFSIPVSTIALVNHKSVNATLVTSDAANNSITATADRAVSVDTALALSVEIDNIAIDDVVNRAESQSAITLKGSYATESDVKADSVKIAVLIGGESRQAVVNEADKTWSLVVRGEELATSEGTHSITATIQAEDNAGNQNSVKVEHQYSVDTQIVKPVVTITSIAGDDVIDSTEAKGSITIKGIVEHVEGDGSVTILCPCESCTSGWKEVEAQVVDGKFEVNVTVSETSLANAKRQSSERIVKAKYTAEDKAGNTAEADEVSRPYELDLYKEINITKIGNNFDFTPSETTRIYGKITEFGTLNNAVADAYNQGLNARFIRMLKVNIGDKSYQVGFNSVEKTFYVDIPNSDLPDIAGKVVSLDFTAPLTNNRVNPSNYYGGDTILNVLITNQDGSKRFDVANRLVPTAKEFTLEGDILVKKDDNSYSVRDFIAEKAEISGTVKGDIAVGAEIDVKVGNQIFTTQVEEGKTFKVEVERALLQDNVEKTVTATLKADATVRDVEAYTSENATSETFKSSHSLVDRGQRNIDHTSENYNFFYPIHLLETGSVKSGFLNLYDPATTQEPMVVKIHYVTEEEAALLPSTTQGFAGISAGSQTAVPQGLKELFKQVFNEISSKTNIKFEEVGTVDEVSNGKGSLIFAGDILPLGNTIPPAYAYSGGNIVWKSSANPVNANDDYVFQLAIHEVLHTLNMQHTNTSFLSGGVNYKGEETLEFSNLSYFRPRLLMGLRDLRMYDMAYLHYRFGVNSEHRKGNDVYTFKTYDAMKSDGDIYIWDGNGVDTFDASSEKEGVTVNLTPGSWNYRGETKGKFFVNEGFTNFTPKAYFGLDESEIVSGNFSNRGSTYYGGDTNPPAGQAQFGNYIFDGQSFIGYGTQIENLIGSAYKDTLTGNNADNNIFGGAGDDTIAGGLGNDFINGGEGIDLMFGEEGDDIYVVDNVGDVATENVGEGTDHVYSIIDFTEANKLFDNVENLTLVGMAAKDATGNNLNNTLRGNDIGNTLRGLEGNDILIGGLGVDTLIGGAGDDIFVFESMLNGKADSITDFTAGDKIQLSKDIFASLANDLANLNDHLFYDQASGQLSYNSDTTGAEYSVNFAMVQGLQSLDADMFILA